MASRILKIANIHQSVYYYSNDTVFLQIQKLVAFLDRNYLPKIKDEAIAKTNTG